MKTLLARIWIAFRALSPWELLRVAAEAALKTELGAVTREVVAEVERIYTELPGIEKHRIAFERIKAEATKGGIAWRASLINLFIELGVYALKKAWESLKNDG